MISSENSLLGRSPAGAIDPPRRFLKDGLDQGREPGLDLGAQALAPADVRRLYAEDDDGGKPAIQRASQRQDLREPGVMEGELMWRLVQPDLIRGEADKLPRDEPLSACVNVSGVHDDDVVPAFDDLEDIEAPRPPIQGCDTRRQLPSLQLLDDPWADAVVAAQRVAQAQDENGELRSRGLAIHVSSHDCDWGDPLAHTNSTVRTWAEQEMQGS